MLRWQIALLVATAIVSVGYSRAQKGDAENAQVQRALSPLSRARVRAADQHATEGRRLAARGLYKEAPPPTPQEP